MLDGNHTTHEWQVHAGKVCVWPVGSFEQHSVHLPLATDTIMAEHFARIIAEELQAALLPALPYGTCLEQTGFRGSLTLRPETLMGIVRDVADEMERQGFATLVLLNGHGGNHALVPVVRDINRLNRPIKILLVNFWEHGDPALAKECRQHGPAFHSDAWETSVMLALRPDLVRPERVDMAKPPEAPYPLGQSDLSTFGVGHVAPEGATGFPSMATAERGQRIVASIRERIVPFVRDRLARLEGNRRYSGAGGMAIRLLSEADIPEGMRLKELAGWNQTEADWRVYLGLAPKSCLGAVHNGRIVGTATAIDYSGSCGWVGMMLVHPDFRRLGIGKRLMESAIQCLGHCGRIKLDATPAGRPLYGKLGFVDEGVISRMVSPCVAGPVPTGAAAARMQAGDLDRAAKDEAVAFGADRQALLSRMLSGVPALAWKVESGGRLRAFCLGRSGAKFDHIGPVIADSMDSARSVVTAALAELAGRPAVLDVPEARRDMSGWLASLGFTVQRQLFRMRRGEPLPADPSRLCATAGPDLG